jgi:hypothetical protein
MSFISFCSHRIRNKNPITGKLGTLRQAEIQKYFDSPIQFLEICINELPKHLNDKGSFEKLDLIFQKILQIMSTLTELQQKKIGKLYTIFKTYLPEPPEPKIKPLSAHQLKTMPPKVIVKYNALSDDEKITFTKYFNYLYSLAMARHKKKSLNPAINEIETQISGTLALYCFEDPYLKPTSNEDFLELHRIVLESLSKSKENEVKNLNESLSTTLDDVEKWRKETPNNSISCKNSKKIDELLNSIRELGREVQLLNLKLQGRRRQVKQLEKDGQNSSEIKLYIEEAEMERHQGLLKFQDKVNETEKFLKDLMSQNLIDENAKNQANEEIKRIHSEMLYSKIPKGNLDRSPQSSKTPTKPIRKNETKVSFLTGKDENILFDQYFDFFYDEMKNRHLRITRGVDLLRKHQETLDSDEFSSKILKEFLRELESSVLKEIKSLVD